MSCGNSATCERNRVVNYHLCAQLSPSVLILSCFAQSNGERSLRSQIYGCDSLCNALRRILKVMKCNTTSIKRLGFHGRYRSSMKNTVRCGSHYSAIAKRSNGYLARSSVSHLMRSILMILHSRAVSSRHHRLNSTNTNHTRIHSKCRNQPSTPLMLISIRVRWCLARRNLRISAES